METHARPLTQDAIRSYVGEVSFGRGRAYWQSGAISDGRRQGDLVKGRCAGSYDNEYRVEATVSDAVIRSSHCSCPVGGAGRCKHVAALLLEWCDTPEAFIEIEPLDTALERRSKEELIALIRQMLRIEPELESLLSLPLPVEGRSQFDDPAAFRRQAEAAFRRQGREWDILRDVADSLRAVYALGADFEQAGNPVGAAAVYRAVLEVLIERYPDYSDEEGELACVIGECVELLGRLLPALQEHAGVREAVLRLLLDAFLLDVRCGGQSLADEAPALLVEESSAEERQTLAGWVRDALPAARGDWEREALGALLLDLEADQLGDEEFLEVCRRTGRRGDLVDRLLALDRIEEATAEANGASDYYLLVLADLFEAHSLGEQAEALVRERARRSTDLRLKEWLKARHAARGDIPAALELAEQVFRSQPHLGGYREVRHLAQQAGRWETVRPPLMSFVEAQHSYLLIPIFLDEGEIENALQALRTGRGAASWYGGDLRVTVAAAAEATHPKEAIALYREVAESLIERRGRNNYAVASEYLRKAQDLHVQLGDEPGWQRYFAALRERYQGLPALRDELGRAGL